MLVNVDLFSSYKTHLKQLDTICAASAVMPLTMIFCVIGAASISAFPLFSGFVSKSLILDAAAENRYPWVWAVLVFASAGVLSHSGIKIPYFAFFAHDSGKRPKEAPTHMLIAMGLTAFACIFIGVFPSALYALLPYEVNYVPYTAAHILAQLQLLFFALFAFALLMRYGFFPAETRTVNLDTDWFYRKLAPAVFGLVNAVVRTVWSELARGAVFTISACLGLLQRLYGPGGRFESVQPTGAMVLWLAILLGAALAVNLISLT